MGTHTRRFTCLFLMVVAVGSRATNVGAQPQPSEQPAPDALAQPLDLSVAHAGLAEAVAALNATKSVSARCEGPTPDREVTLALKATPLRDVLDALAALYGVQWAMREGTAVFSPRKADADGTGPVRPDQAQPAKAHPPAPGDAGATDVPMPGLPALGASGTTRDPVQLLRSLGIGLGPEPPPGDPAQQAQIASALACLFPPQARQRMAQAGPDAYHFGVRVGDMPPAVRSMVLEWQMALHNRQVQIHLWQAVQPFDAEKYLNAVMYLSVATDADGLPRGAPSLALRGADWSKTWALFLTR